MTAQTENAPFVLEGARAQWGPWTEVERLESRDAAIRAFEAAKRRFPDYFYFRVQHLDKTLWQHTY
jgi:hypothetical protein